MNRKLWLAFLSAWMMAFLVRPVWADTPVVQAVLFYSPSCPHCQKVLHEGLRPLQDKYGDQLQVFMVDVTQPDGHALFESAGQRYHLETLAVPTLIIGEVVLVGSVAIPEKLPALIDEHLAEGGIGWPDIPGLPEALETAQPAITPTATAAVTPTLPSNSSTLISTAVLPSTTLAVRPQPSATVAALVQAASASEGIFANLARDMMGSSAAIAVLLWMVFVVVRASQTLWSGHSSGQPLQAWQGWAIPILCLCGSSVAAYLLYVESTQVEAVCGPVGDCNAVQQSEYARLFGLIPIGLLGLSGYVTIMVAWWAARYLRWREQALTTLLALTLAGTLFSIYLTFLEPFVIGAVCAWCLTSAVIMTALLWLTVVPGQHAVANFLRPATTR